MSKKQKKENWMAKQMTEIAKKRQERATSQKKKTQQRVSEDCRKDRKQHYSDIY